MEGLRAERLLAPMFDESLPVPDLSKQLVIWNFGGLKLPSVNEEYQAHLHSQTTPSMRAAQALYGLAADLAQSLFFSRDTQPDFLVVEECAPPGHTRPAGSAARTLSSGRAARSGHSSSASARATQRLRVLEDEFIEQRILLGFKEASIAEDTLRWCGRDLERHPKLLTDYVTQTSPSQIANYGDDSIDSNHGKVIAGREGEAWVLERIRRFRQGTAVRRTHRRAAQLYDTNPHRARQRARRTPA